MEWIKTVPQKFKEYLQKDSGDKKIINLKRALPIAGATLLFVFVLSSFLSPKPDRTFYSHKSVSRQDKPEVPQKVEVSQSVAELFGHGRQQLNESKQRDLDLKRKRISIKYFAPQILGVNTKSQKLIRSGAKLIGRLMRSIDTRNPSPVLVKLPNGGESAGVEIQSGSSLIGQFNYPGSGDRIYLSFYRLDTPDGDSKKIAAQALESRDYSMGIDGEEFTGNGVKIASSLGLTMFSGMTDTLTDRESMGPFNGAQAKPTMKNALLQGASQASRDQASRTASQINSTKSYVLVPEGKEMIIELSEDFKNDEQRP